MIMIFRYGQRRKNQRANKPLEPDFFLQWGNKKRLRCVRVRDPRIISQRSDGVLSRKITSRFDRRIVSPATEKETFHPQSNRLTRNSEAATLRSSVMRTGNRHRLRKKTETRGLKAWEVWRLIQNEGLPH
ncbi:hypothetical protein GH714_022544 [Hevea brasiliensis]|uniref:Uncharacterized protein n=1 Tax=Hevea brasiliensis TaxID=3981 RepID=A0A6A6M3J6_HEVBR|nr:hypothetical protein GH714_022544 [Hevea brasiliensis]